MPTRTNASSKKPQKKGLTQLLEGSDRIQLQDNKRDREECTVQNPVAISPEIKRGTIVAYMSGANQPATPRRGEGKKKSRVNEHMEDSTDDEEFYDNREATKKANAAVWDCKYFIITHKTH